MDLKMLKLLNAFLENLKTFTVYFYMLHNLSVYFLLTLSACDI